MLTAIKPAWAIFTLPQRDLTPVREAMLKGEVPALAFDQDNTRELAKGTLLLIDNQIDQLTSTIRLKASFPNEDERLWPGEFVRVRVSVNTLKNAVTIPSAAVQRSSQGVFAWVVKPDDTVENRHHRGGAEHRRHHRGDERAERRRARRGERPIPVASWAKVAVNAAPAPVAEGHSLMNISAPFIRRPVATSLLMIAIALLGLAAWPLSAGGAAAAGRLSDHQHFGVAPRRKPGDHGVGRGPAFGAPVRHRSPASRR